MPRNDELPGIYFNETVTSIDNETGIDELVCFILQTTSDIETLDNQLVLQTSLESFKNLCNGKGLDKTVAFIEGFLELTGMTNFYTYSIKDNTINGYQEAVNCSDHIKEIRRIIYFEETLSTDPTITQKMNALITACHSCYNYGAFRVAYVIPSATIENAVNNKAEGDTNNDAIIQSYTTMLNGIGDGRLVTILPDGEISSMATIVETPFYQDPGHDVIVGDVQLKYKFNREEMKTLMNLGVIFIRKTRFNGVNQYKILSGVNTGFKESKSDGVISARGIADELLHEVDIALDSFINDNEHENNVSFVQTAVDTVISGYANNMYVDGTRTNLTVTDAGNMRFAIDGQITTIKPLKVINVNTTIN